MRVFTVLGPSHSGKTTLVEALAALEGSPGKTLTVANTASVRTFGFMGEDWAAIDIAGGSENLGPVGPALAASDIAVICVPADADAAVLSAPYLRMVEEAGVPCILFINRIDSPQSRISEVVSALQTYSRHHIVLREVPIRDGDKITGFVDLVSERAWKFEDGKHSVLIEMPDSVKDREEEARADLLESYADFDDTLMEELIEDKQPMVEEIYEIASKTVQHHDLVACFMGSASARHGITRLMKSLRHDAPSVEVARARLEDETRAVGALADVIKHLGKVVVLRAMDGAVTSGTTLAGGNLGAITDLDAKSPLGTLAAGQIGLAVKSDQLAAGRACGDDTSAPLPGWAQVHASSYRRIVTPEHEKDDSRLLTALERLSEIDPGLRVSQDEKTGNPVLATQGPLHLRRILAKIVDEFGVAVTEAPVPPALRETIRRGAEIHHRHRKQTGGAGQFADVVVELRPEARGAGFTFTESVKGGAVPRNYIPSVEAGAREALAEGPNGFPVVDVSVELKDGKTHSVDSSDYAFRTAGKNAIREALTEVGTQLLQPIMKIDIHVPSVFSGALVPLVSGLKGQVLGFEAHPSAAGWDVFQLLLPMAAEDELFAALAGATRGTAWFTSAFDHYQEARKEDLADLIAS
ncbi:elongation factor G [Pseudothioclava nitratireducens]|uniref:elongation factor G n=1 Tax=Pseudothioclava nitratireducens TaxID=1928646 RepID=UPI0023DC86D9|nr:elongation factor G [Defluviimonas nitratireducens]MDF1621069.1 elongation factor G [Defluviimonas nitratireducens]